MADHDERINKGGNKKDKNKGGANALTKEALKKARKKKQAGVNTTAADGGDKSPTRGNKTMWDFVNKGGAASAVAASGDALVGGGKKSRGVAGGGASGGGGSNALSDGTAVGQYIFG